MPDATPSRTAAPEAVWSDLVAAHAEATAAAAPTGSFPEHRPVAAVLACSDARVPPSLIFGQPAGRLFVVRLAGNSATPAAIASLTYAVESLATPLLVVLGHSGCGAVTAALSAMRAPELRPVLDPIDEMLAGTATDTDDVDAAVAANVRHNLRRLARERGPLGAAITEGRVALRGAVHDLRTGELIDVTPDDLIPIPPQPTRSTQ